jgi:hypothetical protein
VLPVTVITVVEGYSAGAVTVSAPLLEALPARAVELLGVPRKTAL